MKILFIAAATGLDYQCDVLFHGLREIYGPDVVDARRLWYLYRPDVTPEVKRSLYGRGFTVAGRLPEIAVDRDDLKAKIRSRYFDWIVYGSAWRCLDWLELVVQQYPPERIALIDGEDQPWIRTDLLPHGRYFKRECTRSSVRCIPINFAIPAELVRSSVAPKQRVLATVLPGVKETYLFEEEQAYHDDYASSSLGLTIKKAGWDCMRHYEIMAAGCVPYFHGIEQCPSHTMIQMPKRFLREVQRWVATGRELPVEAFEACRRFAEERLTTAVLARDFLDAMRTGRRRLPDTSIPVLRHPEWMLG